MADSNSIRLAEAIGALSLATDLASGQPMEHGLRRALIALNLGEAFGLSEGELSTVFYVALLGGLGCVFNTAAIAPFVRDEIQVRGEMFTEDLSKPLPTMLFLARRVGAGEPLPTRLVKFLGIARSEPIFRDVALNVGAMLDLGEEVRFAVGQCEEHWNGKGGSLGLLEEQIATSARLFLLAQDADVFSRLGGPDAAIAVARQRSGTYYDPRLVDIFCKQAPTLLASIQGSQAWDVLLESEPKPVRFLDSQEIDVVAQQIGDLIDMRSPFTLGHSKRVAELAAAASSMLGLSDWETTLVRRAGFFHDLGRLGVPVATWHRTGTLTAAEWQAMRAHPAATELMLSRASTLGPVGSIGGLHHERADGSGYRGATIASLPLTASLLATSDAYQTRLETRPHRPAFIPEQAAEALRRDAADGRFDPHIVEVVLGSSSTPTQKSAHRQLPAGLTEREVEVLRLAVRGLSNREMSQHLVVSPKTIGHHIESIYSKLGVSTRVGATMFAVKHALVDF